MPLSDSIFDSSSCLKHNLTNLTLNVVLMLDKFRRLLAKVSVGCILTFVCRYIMKPHHRLPHCIQQDKVMSLRACLLLVVILLRLFGKCANFHLLRRIISQARVGESIYIYTYNLLHLYTAHTYTHNVPFSYYSNFELRDGLKEEDCLLFKVNCSVIFTKCHGQNGEKVLNMKSK